MSHTPGPWTVDEHQCVYAGDQRVAIVEVLARDIEANARLIAAAPDLLAALDDLVDASDYLTDVTDFDRQIIGHGGVEHRVDQHCDFCAAREIAREALARVGGENADSANLKGTDPDLHIGEPS